MGSYTNGQHRTSGTRGLQAHKEETVLQACLVLAVGDPGGDHRRGYRWRRWEQCEFCALGQQCSSLIAGTRGHYGGGAQLVHTGTGTGTGC